MRATVHRVATPQTAAMCGLFSAEGTDSVSGKVQSLLHFLCLNDCSGEDAVFHNREGQTASVFSHISSHIKLKNRVQHLF